MSTTEIVIADALRRYLADHLGAQVRSRAFFRLSGFGEEVYVALLDMLAASGWRLADKELDVRSIAPIAGYAERAIPAEQPATLYRNTLVSGIGLLLIQNRNSTDAQSLKDLYGVTELSLSRDGLPHLIAACFSRFQLDDGERAMLAGWTRKLARVLYEPQLRDLTEFLCAVDERLDRRPGTPLAEAITDALPALNLFRCRELAAHLTTPHGDKLLRQLHTAARIGSEVIGERDRGDYLRRLEHADLGDDASLGGLDSAAKRALLRRFIEGQLHDRDELLQVLRIDWREIQGIITAKGREKRSDKLLRIAAAVQQLLPPDEELADEVAEVRADLGAGRDPDADAVDRLLADHGEQLPRALRNELRRLVKSRTRKHGDLLVGLTALAVELLQPLQGELQAGTRLRIVPQLDAASDQKHLPEALVAFRALYGGVERAIPHVEWQLDVIGQRLAAAMSADDEPADDDEQQKALRLELPFRVTVLRADESELDRADLIWQYRSDSPTAATALTLSAEQARLDTSATPGSLRVPIFNGCRSADAIDDLDLRRPVHSLGVWYEQTGDLRAMLSAQLQRRVRPQAAAHLDAALGQLEAAWGGFVAVAAERGLFAADSAGLIDAYEALLGTAVEQLRTELEAKTAYKLLNQAWLIGPPRFERWAVMPLLHPLKLLWWRERARYFDEVIGQLLDPAQVTQIVDEPRYRRELAVTYGSSGFPPLLALPTGDGLPAERFLAAEEADGYELFLRESERSESFGADTELLADDERAIAAQRAVEGITAVVQDYLETYPFVRDGLEIVLYECRNSALPGLLVERLRAAAARYGWQVRLVVVVHTSDAGAPLFQRVSEWVETTRAADERGSAYFPAVSLTVLQGGLEQLLEAAEDSDIVILADVLAAQGQRVSSRLGAAPPDLLQVGYRPTYRAQQEPFRQGDIYRRLLLSQIQQPALARLFLLAQHAAKAEQPVASGEAARFYRELTLGPWEPVLDTLHDHFNWVVCYDPTIDRFLMQSSFPEKVQVIRYSLGLGAKRQHNLTVSSSHKARGIVERRLAARLGQMLPQAPREFLIAVATQLIERANEVSGDIVLRAAGPGAFLNELIGLVAARFETERRFRAAHPDALSTWVLLDDFEHWFSGKFPDLLFVAISDNDGQLQLHMEVLEAKCVGQVSFEAESADAEEQLRHGIGRLAQAFAPGGAQLDALYWYDQLYRAVSGNLRVELEQQALWELFRDQVSSGAFELHMTGHCWAFCYDGQAGIVGGPDEHEIARRAPNAPQVALHARHYGRNELCRILRALVEASELEHPPPQVWASPNDGHAAPTEAMAPPIEADSNHSDTEAQSAGVAPTPPLSTSPAPPRTVAPPAPDAEQQWLAAKATELGQALRRRGVQVQRIDPADAEVGPSVVRFKLRLSGNEKLARLQNAALDLARDLALNRTPFIDNVLGTNFVGIDVPRPQPETIELLPLLRGLGRPASGDLPIILGKTPDGRLLIDDLATFPHVLVAGATGSGKSVFLRSLLLSLMTQYRPGQLELLIVDPKQTDFSFFDGLPFLRGGKVFTDAAEARDALLELVRSEMPRRQQLMRGRSMRLREFNQRFPDEAQPPIVAMIDEYAQLLSIMNKKDGEQFERDLMSLAAVARATSIHLVLATQRPSVDVVTGTLKANLPTRVAFQVPTNNDSRVVLDATGAENLLGRGDMLYRRPSGEMLRLQAPFMDEEAMMAYLQELVG